MDDPRLARYDDRQKRELLGQLVVRSQTTKPPSVFPSSSVLCLSTCILSLLCFIYVAFVDRPYDRDSTRSLPNGTGPASTLVL